MEIYTNNADRKVYLDVPVTMNQDEDIDVSFYNDGVKVGEAGSIVSEDDGRYSVTIPFSLTQTEKQLEVKWSFSYDEDGETFEYNRSSYVDVVTPILSFREIKLIHPNATPDELYKIEKATRHIIYAHTGQSFGLFQGVKSLRGAGDRLLLLPSRLIRLGKINGIEGGMQFKVGFDGWTLAYLPWGVPPVKADAWGYHQHVGGVIHNPNSVKLGQWGSGVEYEVEGDWGWEEIPGSITEAAKLLVNDYACGDITYRDKYLTSMTAADWRIQFNSGAFLKTGNVRADQLISPYVLKRGWAVI